MKHTITLPNMRTVSVGTYVQAWKALKAAPDGIYPGFFAAPVEKNEILREISRGVDHRIIRRSPQYLARKWDCTAEFRRLARMLRERVVIRRVALTIEQRAIMDRRFPHRYHTND